MGDNLIKLKLSSNYVDYCITNQIKVRKALFREILN